MKLSRTLGRVAAAGLLAAMLALPQTAVAAASAANPSKTKVPAGDVAARCHAASQAKYPSGTLSKGKRVSLIDRCIRNNGVFDG